MPLLLVVQVTALFKQSRVYGDQIHTHATNSDAEGKDSPKGSVNKALKNGDIAANKARALIEHGLTQK